MMRCLSGIAAASIALLGAGAVNEVPAHLTVQTKGCAALRPDKPIHLSFWQSNHYPGVGDEAARRTTSTQHVDITLPAGYYRVMLSGRGCWEQAQWFALVDGKPRSVAVQFESFRAKAGVDYDMYDAPKGAVAGIVPPGTQRVELVPLQSQAAQQLAVQIQNGAYYADVVAPGNYIIRAQRNDVIMEKRALVTKDHLTQVDFGEASVTQDK